ncbi:hypothetical protein [Leptospira kmetyi]|uniref:hypothetical protein n=1 Tax=Leptospira kmetyi TaxID=408139 RepID=UPI0010837384|nr:hypothetical protein [Leptospira kmetyi]TGK21774.1 hypothetical protein EHO62_05050 [Leptospira kmetyi]TGK28701.1 hypothetical protein EHO66_14530 [Leptospira kmetyi]
MMNISNLISNYDFDLKLRDTYALYGSAPLAAEITRYIQDASPEGYGHAVTYARDFLIGSDLTKEEKNRFYTDLKEHGFMNVLVKNLNPVNRSKTLSSIYNIGKISESENAQYLEYAYENYYKPSVEPILSYRCLFELSWLGSSKYKDYLADLENSKDMISIFIIALLLNSKPQLEVGETTSESVFQRMFGVQYKSEEYENSIVKRISLLESKFCELQEQMVDPVLVRNGFENFIAELRSNQI